MTTISNDMIETDFVEWGYEWDSQYNRTVLDYFHSNQGLFLPFVEPNFGVLNAGFKSFLNSSRIIDTVYNPVEDQIENITLGDLLNNMSVTINGETSLPAILDTFTETRRNYTFVFDMSNAMFDLFYNETAGEDQYARYDKYIYKMEGGFSAGGILEYYSETFESSKIILNEQTKEEESLAFYYGDLPPETQESAYPLWCSIFGLFIPLIAVFVIHKKTARSNKKNTLKRMVKT
ncbi:MAG: hypothetical protein U9O98_07850 [Asgard group archaeon]|nr:hypothetical protein [Asgard group archaeon]